MEPIITALIVVLAVGLVCAIVVSCWCFHGVSEVFVGYMNNRFVLFHDMIIIIQNLIEITLVVTELTRY